MDWLAILLLGFFLGMRHATDTDHVVAVTTIVSRERSLRSALWLGVLWGLGHSATILAVGGAIVVFGWVVPPRLGLSMELSVAVMLILLGAMNLRSTLRRVEQLAAEPSVEGDDVGSTLSQRAGAKKIGWRSLCVGVVHGLAGSAAVALLVLGALPSPAGGLLYLAVFGLGTLVGMALLTTALALPMATLAARFVNLERVLIRSTGALSLLFGLFLVYQIGVLDGLFTGSPEWRPK